MITLAFLYVLTSNFLWAHVGHEHKSQEIVEKAKLQAINALYLKEIKPIFSKKCMDCHSDFTEFPWYYSIIGIKQLINSDIKEAKKHLDFSDDFPFLGHGTPREDLEAIRKVVTDGSMPLWRYRLLHRNSAITDEERKAIIKWVDESLKIIESKR